MTDKITAAICLSENYIQAPVFFLYQYLFIQNSDLDQQMGKDCNGAAHKLGLA